MHKRLVLLLLLLTSAVHAAPRAADLDDESGDRGVVVNTCDPYGFILFKKRVQESLKSVNLSRAFLTTDKVTFRWSTSWSGKMNCLGGSDYVFFFSALGSDPYYIEFASLNNEPSYWVKFTAQVNGPEKTKVRGLGGVHRIANYRTDYLITAELLASPPGSDVRKRTVVNNIVNFPVMVMSGHGGSDKGYGGISNNKYTYGDEVWGYVEQSTPASGWNTDHYLAYEQLAIQFEPNKTTCDLAHGMTVFLNPVSIDELRKKGSTGYTAFTLPIECQGQLGNSLATRNVTAWLASNDVLESDSVGYIIVNDDSDALGVGISLRTAAGQKVAIANGIGSAPGTTELLNIKQGQDISRRPWINLVAYYPVYDATQLSTGNVIATAQLMFIYD